VTPRSALGKKKGNNYDAGHTFYGCTYSVMSKVQLNLLPEFDAAWEFIVGDTKKLKTIIEKFVLTDAIASDFDFPEAVRRYGSLVTHGGRNASLSFRVGDNDVAHPYFASSCLVPFVTIIVLFQQAIPADHEGQVKSFLDLKSAVQALEPLVEVCAKDENASQMPRIAALLAEASSMWAVLSLFI
jgi:hypothetical protein